MKTDTFMKTAGRLSMHSFSTLTKQNLKLNEALRVRLNAWITQPLNFSGESYFKGEALQSSIDPSVYSNNPDSTLQVSL